MKTIRMGKQGLHIEAPGVIVNIERLKDSVDRNVTRVDVNANGDTCWWCQDAGSILGRRGIGIRIVQGNNPPLDDDLFNALFALFRRGMSPSDIKNSVDEAWEQHDNTAVW